MGIYVDRINYGLNRFGQPENYTQFEEDGTLKMEGTATVYNDVFISGTSLVPLGVAAPDPISFVDSNLMVYGFDGGNTTERLFATLEMQHDYKEGTDVELHIHWAPTTAGTGFVVWQTYVSWANSGDTFAAGTLTAATKVAAGGTAWANKYGTLVTLSGVGKTINSQIVLQLFRDPTATDDTYAGDAALIQVGIHYQCDTLGSRTETAK